MVNKVEISKDLINSLESSEDFFNLIIENYQRVFEAEDKAMNVIFNEEQISLFFYNFMIQQVLNGGFIQLIYNGYAPYIFESPLIDSLKEWNAHSISELLVRMKHDVSLIQEDIKSKKSKSLEDLQRLYKDYPIFHKYDLQFEENHGFKEVIYHIKKHHQKFFKTI